MQADAMLCGLDPRHIHEAVRRGIAPAMGLQANYSYWGSPIPERLDEATHKFLGARPPPTECADARAILENAKNLDCNARQLVAVCRGGFGQGSAPTFPEEVTGKPEEAPELFSGGGVKNPANR